MRLHKHLQFSGTILALLFCSPALAQNASVVSGMGELTRAGRVYNAGRGALLLEGDKIKGAPFVQAIGPYEAWNLKTKGSVVISLLRRVGCGYRTEFLYVGQTGLSTRRPTCKDTVTTIVSYLTLASFKANSDLQLNDIGKTTVLQVDEGSVEATSAGKTTAIPGGYGNRTVEGKPPGPPIKIDYSLGLYDYRQRMTPRGLRVTGKTSPLNRVELQGVEILPNDAGCFAALVRLPVTSNALQVRVLGGDRARAYSFAVPSRKF